MNSMLLAYRQRARLLGHDLCVAQRTDGKWLVWIEGRRALQHEPSVTNQDEAKKVVHLLAHWHIEGKHLCDCGKDLRWEPLHSITTSPQPERRKARRVPHVCEVRFEDQGASRIGRIGNLSTEGAFIETPRPSFKGSVVTLSFRVGPLHVRARGEVIHRSPQQGMGVRFLNLEPSCRAAIADLITKRND